MNPDFGQVEVDPAVVNLSAFETFFDEKRPFFLEGAQTFGNFGRDGATDNWGFNSSDPNIFYSRRIGRAPQISPSGDFIDAPHATTILGAAKITGKTPGGWTLAAARRGHRSRDARVRTGLVSDRTTVEPLTNYFAARLQRTIRPPRGRRAHCHDGLSTARRTGAGRRARRSGVRRRRRRLLVSERRAQLGDQRETGGQPRQRQPRPSSTRCSAPHSATSSAPTRRKYRSIRTGRRSPATTVVSTSIATAARGA